VSSTCWNRDYVDYTDCHAGVRFGTGEQAVAGVLSLAICWSCVIGTGWNRDYVDYMDCHAGYPVTFFQLDSGGGYLAVVLRDWKLASDTVPRVPLCGTRG